MAVRLRVRLPSGATREWSPTSLPCEVGRDPDCALPLDGDGARTVSWRHLRLEQAGDGVQVVDLGSSNGTFVNDVRCEPSRTAQVGDHISLGRQGPVLEVLPVESPQAPAAAGPFGYLGSELAIPGDPASPAPRAPVSSPAGPPPLAHSPGPARAAEAPSESGASGSGSSGQGATRVMLLKYQSRMQYMVIGLSVLALAGLGATALLYFQPDNDEQLRRLIDRVQNAVVHIEVAREDGGAVGSGYIADAEGTVVTNFHVIRQGLRAQVTFQDGTTAGVVGFVHVDREHDLALLRLEAARSSLPKPLPLAEQVPEKGALLMAFGSPRGFQGSFSRGEMVTMRTGAQLAELGLSGMAADSTWVQTTAPVLHGNSGGPLVNGKGEVVGINTMGPNETLNFASSAANIRAAMSKAHEEPRPFSELP